MSSFFSPPIADDSLDTASDNAIESESEALERNSPQGSRPPFFSDLSKELRSIEKKKLASELRHAAFDLLARREHSQQEIREKLTRKIKNRYEDISLELLQEQLELLLVKIVEEGLQSDERYLDMLVKGRINQGHGPLRIAQELKQKKISASEYTALLDSRGEEWMIRARQVKEKKFGVGSPSDHKSKAKQMRFLQYRGFNSDQIRYAMSVN